MSTNVWYYVDRHQQRQGPVDAEIIREAYRGGQIDGESLVWREGMSQWAPLKQFELEFDLEDEPSPLASAPTMALPPTRYDAPAPAYASPYAPPMATVATDVDFDGGASDIVYAGFWRRFCALFVDGLLVATVNYAIFFVLLLVFGMGGGLLSGMENAASGLNGAMMGLQLSMYVIGLGISAGYFVLQESSEAQATLGKRLVGIKVTDLQGQRLSRLHALGRWASHLLCYFTLYIGYVMAAFTDRKQGLHDMVASTLVVDQWAYTSHPGLQKRELGGCLITFIVVFFSLIVLFVGGVLFAIAAIGQGGWH